MHNSSAFKYSYLYLLGCLLSLLVSNVLAQDKSSPLERSFSQSHPILNEIQRSFESGQITLDQKILYRFYAGLQPQALPSAYHADDFEAIKCGLPTIGEFHALHDQLSPVTRQQIQSLLQRETQAQESELSPSKKFEIHYDVSGFNAVPDEDSDGDGTPDYVEEVAAAADSSWRHEVQNLGHTDPVTGDSKPYPVYIENIGHTYGYTAYGSDRGLNADTYIVIHSDFEGYNFPLNDDPEGDYIGSIKVTMAHELKHAIQYANSKWYGWEGTGNPNSDSPHSTSWAEMDATLMEEMVYDNVNDYYYYLTNSNRNSRSIFENGDHTIPASYSGVTWFIYFWERYGENFWSTVWDRIQQRYSDEQGQQNPDYLTMLEAITATLKQDHSTSFENALAESHLWHYASGDKSQENYGFEEREQYPNAIVYRSLAARDSLEQNHSIPPLSADYVPVTKGETLIGNVRVIAEFDQPTANFGILGIFRDGSTQTLLRPGSSSNRLEITTNWSWDDIKSLGIITTNSSKNSHIGYNIKVTLSVPEQITVLQNYPNPFNPSTTISFSLPEETEVDLVIYNSIGQRVAELIDGTEMPSGFHEIPFIGNSLSSGVYFYRLITDEKVFVKKMTLIK